jgi:hypothetical protein
MITIDDIKQNSFKHPACNGKIVRIANDKTLLSIVGGDTGLYGDFEDTFEIAIFDIATNKFITSFFYPDNNDDVVGYLGKEELLSICNKLFKKGFQFNPKY